MAGSSRSFSFVLRQIVTLLLCLDVQGGQHQRPKPQSLEAREAPPDGDGFRWQFGFASINGSRSITRATEMAHSSCSAKSAGGTVAKPAEKLMHESLREHLDQWPRECTLTNGSNSPAAQPASQPTPTAAAVPTPQLINPLGFIQSSLAGVTVDDLLKNKPALTMLLHDHNRLNHENGSLSNALNTANTYVRGYEDAKTRARTGAVFQAAAAIPIGFSINILTGGNAALVTTGWAVLAIGICFQAIGLYYAFWGEN